MLSQFHITIDGVPMGAEMHRAVSLITVENSLHLPDVATIELNDPRLIWVDDGRLAPGKTITIKASAGDHEGPLFDGEIVELEPIFEPDTQRLLIRAFDRLHRLDRGLHVRTFINVTDDDVFAKLAKDAGLGCRVRVTSSRVHPYLFQANESNLQFLQRRAAVNGRLLFVDGATLCCEPPASDQAPISLVWGQTMAEFRPRLSTLGQVNTVSARGWDPAQRQAILGRVSKPQWVPETGIGRSAGDLAREAFNIDANHTVVNIPLRKQADADVLARAVANRIASHYIEADGLCGGRPDIVAGAAVEITGVGKRFSGRYFVTSSTHTYDPDQGYQLQFTVSGLHPSTMLSLLSPAQHDPVGLGYGLVVGVVTDNKDPEGQGRVKLKYPWLSEDHASDWARVVAVGGGPNRGIQFLPEINDEVLVGFELNDIQHPYVIGGLWNGKDRLPDPNGAVDNGRVVRRIIRSRQGHEIVLDDTDGQQRILVRHINGSAVTIEEHTLTINDVSGNKITLDPGGISVSSSGNLSLEAQGQVTIKGAVINLN